MEIFRDTVVVFLLFPTGDVLFYTRIKKLSVTCFVDRIVLYYLLTILRYITRMIYIATVLYHGVNTLQTIFQILSIFTPRC